MRNPAIRVLAGVPFLLLVACSEPEGEISAQPTPDATASSPFVDATEASNISYRVGYTRPSLIGRGNLAYQVSLMTHGGVAAGDCDRDGDIDLFITYGNTGGPDGGGGPNRLYLNQLAEQENGLLFEDNAEAAGVANTRPDGRNDRHSGPTFADMDGDGDLDLFLGGIYDDPSRIYENDGSCRFADVTANSPELQSMLASHTISAGFGDYDLDGDLDMFLTHWATPDRLYGAVGGVRLLETDHLWRNDSDDTGIRFVNVSEESDISDAVWLTRSYPGTYDFPFSAQEFDFTFTPIFARLNADLWPDIALAADFGTTQILVNAGDGTFLSSEKRILREAQFGMGSALGDIDNDGDLDWFVTSILGPGTNVITPHGNRLFENVGGSDLVMDVTAPLGVADGSFGWGACLVDLDNDMDLDIYHTNGFPENFLTDRDAYQNDTSRVFMMDESGAYTERGEDLGLAAPTSGRGIVCADFDHDGDIDIFELTDAAPNSATLWENRSATAGRRFLRLQLEGLPPNTEAAGARIFVTVGDVRQMREISIGSNYTSQNPTVQVFGLGDAESVDEILVEWPPLDSDGGPSQLGTLLSGPIAAGQPGQTIVIRHPELPAR